MVKCATLRKCACDEVFCLDGLSRARHSLMSVREILEKNNVSLKESVAITLSTNCVRVATVVVKMMKRKFATRRFLG